LIFKKIVKKDATTKIKGLEELRKYIEDHASGDHANLDAVLKKWTAEFPRLVEDASPKVRLLAVKLMGLIGSTFKSYVSASYQCIASIEWEIPRESYCEEGQNMRRFSLRPIRCDYGAYLADNPLCVKSTV